MGMSESRFVGSARANAGLKKSIAGRGKRSILEVAALESRTLLSTTFLPQTGWVATDSTNSQGGDVVSNAVDGNLNTRWSTDALQTNIQYFQVNLGAPQSFNTLTMDTGPSTGDYPRGYAVYTSLNGTDWATDPAIATGAGSGQVTTVNFPAQTAQYVRIVQTGSAPGNWWSIGELNIGTNTAAQTTTSPNNPAVVDLLVAYTPAAAASVGGYSPGATN